jgi:hypothetical protein
LPSDEVHNLAHHWTVKGAVHRSEIFPLMSLQGQSRRTTMFAMSGLAPISAMLLQCHDRSKSAKTGREQSQQRQRLFDHLVGAGEQRVRHGEAERFGGLEIDHQLELGRLLNGEVRWPLALEYPVNISCSAPVQI